MFLYIFLLILAVVGACLFVAYRRILNPVTETIDITRFPKKFDQRKELEDSDYDVVIVGGGPAGATTGYYLAKAGKKVLILEKKKFPRDKICGDAICKTGVEILMDMGIWDILVKENKTHVADYGGLVSPGGLSYIGHTEQIYGDIPAATACKRIILDEVIARTAQKEGAELLESTPVKDAVFDSSAGMWNVLIEDSDVQYRGRVLICADGSTSKLGMQLGLVTQPPQGTCSRAFIKNHKFKADGVMFYPRDILPGYGVLLKHPNNEVNFCCYIIPGNPKLTNDTLSHWHHYFLEEDPCVSKAVGKKADIERMKVGSLRIGGEPITYGDHVLLVGDAGGFVDPMTGEGIHTALDSGRIAAKFLVEAFEVGNFDKQLMKEYQNRWMKAFGNDFKWSNAIVQFMYRYPILLDAGTAAILRKGDEYLARWGDVMTGRVPKVNLLRPEFAIVIGYELMVLLFKRFFLGGYEKPLKLE